MEKKSYELRRVLITISAVTTDNKEIWNLWGFVLYSEYQVHFCCWNQAKSFDLFLSLTYLNVCFFWVLFSFFCVLTLTNVILPGYFLADTEQEVQSWGWSPTFCTKSSLFQGTGGSCWRGCFQLLRCFASGWRKKKKGKKELKSCFHWCLHGQNT